MRRSPTRPTSAGFSLVEVMVAAAVLGILVVGITTGLTNMGKTARAATVRDEFEGVRRYVQTFVDCRKTLYKSDGTAICPISDYLPGLSLDGTQIIEASEVGTVLADHYHVRISCYPGDASRMLVEGARYDLNSPKLSIDRLTGKPLDWRDLYPVPMTCSNGLGGGLHLALTYATGSKSLKVDVLLGISKTSTSPQGATTITYVQDSAATKVVPGTGFPPDVVTAISSFSYTAQVVQTGSNSYNLQFKALIPGLTTNGVTAPTQTMTLSQTSTTPSWSKDEGLLDQLSSLPIPGNTPSECAIQANGNQPTSGRYAVVLTKPAPCDFKLPTVTVSGGGSGVSGGGKVATVPVGTYWVTPPPCGEDPVKGCTVAHRFPVKHFRSPPAYLDNGFMLIQPDGITYLLVDAGVADPAYPNYQNAATIANQVSKSQGFGGSVLQQPTASTLFKKGSVIAIYDDTPDMAGSINVNALIAAEADVSLAWDASLVPP